MAHAIRCRVSGKTFRRDGIEFSGNAWTVVEQATERQLAEPMLLCVEADGADDPRLEEALKPVVIAPEALAQTAESEMRGLIVSLQSENADLRVIRDNQVEQAALLKAELQEVQAKASTAEELCRTQAAQIAVLEQTNAELGQEYQRLLQEAEAKAVPAIETSPEPSPEAVSNPPATKESKAGKAASAAPDAGTPNA